MTMTHARRPGFTLIEMLMYMGIIGIILTMLTSIFVSVLDAQQESQTTSAVEIDRRYVLARLSYDIRRSSAITNPAPGLTDSTVAFTADGVSYILGVSGGVLVLQGPSGSEQLTGSGTTVTDFSVTRLGNLSGKDTVRVQFQLTNQQEVRSVQTTVGRR